MPVYIDTIAGDGWVNSLERAAGFDIVGRIVGFPPQTQVSVTVAGVTYTTASQSNGSWSVNIPPQPTWSEGPIDFEASVASERATKAATVDTIAPLLVLQSVAVDNIIDADEAAENVVFSGSTLGDVTLSATLGPFHYSPTLSANGEWLLTVTPGSLPAPGTYVFQVSAADEAGNTTTLINAVMIEPNSLPVNSAPDFQTPVQLVVDEHVRHVATIKATDDESNVLTYSIVGGSDGGLFTIDPTSGALAFRQAPDFETPGSATASNDYKVLVRVSDGLARVEREFTVSVRDVNENAPEDDDDDHTPIAIYLGGPNDDVFRARNENAVYDGLEGRDTVVFEGGRDDYVLAFGAEGRVTVFQGAYSQELTSIERLAFADGALLLDIGGDNVAAIYRLYGGAFDRAPDEAGLFYWKGATEAGLDLVTLAELFLASAEFAAAGDAVASNMGFVAALYRNVLGREGEGGGVDFWTHYLDAGRPRAEVLLQFTQSSEYVGIIEAETENGYWVI